MSEINLLPQDLRRREQQEQHRKAPPPPPSPYSKPSVLEQRLADAEAKQPGFWQTIKSWFNKMPEPVVGDAQPKLMTEPIHQTKKGKILEEQPISGGGWQRFAGGLADWWQGLFKPAEPGARSVTAKDAAQKPKPTVPKPAGAGPTPMSDVPIGVVLDVNLLPVGAQPSQAKPYTKKLWIVAGLSFLFVAIIYSLFFSLITYQQVEVKKVQDEGALLVQEVTALQGQFEELELVSRKMVQIKNLIGNRTNWLKFFESMQGLTLPKVSYKTMSATSDGSVTLQVDALTVGELARQLQIFQEAGDIIAEVAIGSVTVAEADETNPARVSTSFKIQLVAGWLQQQ